MRILFITATFPTPQRPTQGAFNRELVRALSQQHEVRVVAPVPWPQRLRPAPGILRAAPGMAAGHGVAYPTSFYPPKMLRSHYGSFLWHSIRRAVDQLTVDFVPQIVLGYWSHPDGEAAVRAARRAGVPAVVIAGGSDLRLLTRDRRRRAAIGRVLDRAERVVVLSRELAEHTDRLGISRTKIDIIHRGVDRDRFCPGGASEARQTLGIGPCGPHVLWVGRLVDVKNPQMVLRAAVGWKRRWQSHLRVSIIGDGPLGPQLRRMACQLDVDDVCHFVGSVPHAQLPHWYRAADVTVLTSHSEGLPNVLLESIACGTPFVATDVGGVREIATPGADALIPAGNHEALVDQVLQLTQRTKLAKRIFEPDGLPAMAGRFTEALHRAQAGSHLRATG